MARDVSGSPRDENSEPGRALAHRVGGIEQRRQVQAFAGAGDSDVHRVTAEMRRAVLSGSLPPGQALSIADLSTQLVAIQVLAD